MPGMTDDGPGGGLQRCGTGTVEPRICFFQFLKSSGFENYEENRMRGNGERNPHQVARKHISPFWGKCGLRANLALSSFEPRPMCKMAVLVIFSLTDYRFLALAGKFLSGFFNKNVT